MKCICGERWKAKECGHIPISGKNSYFFLKNISIFFHQKLKIFSQKTKRIYQSISAFPKKRHTISPHPKNGPKGIYEVGDFFLRRRRGSEKRVPAQYAMQTVARPTFHPSVRPIIMARRKSPPPIHEGISSSCFSWFL
jgi:hypothetical protein